MGGEFGTSRPRAHVLARRAASTRARTRPPRRPAPRRAAGIRRPRPANESRWNGASRCRDERSRARRSASTTRTWISCSRADSRPARASSPSAPGASTPPCHSRTSSRPAGTSGRSTGCRRCSGCRFRVTPSAFGYSMLYPYTDNLLDDPAISEEEKSRVNERFGRRICGEALAPESDHERALWALFAEIESEHVRAAAPRVYESLEVIHRAQTRSVLLMRRDEPPYAIDVLGISLEKGGASVLADGYLVGRRPHAAAGRPLLRTRRAAATGGRPAGRGR